MPYLGPPRSVGLTISVWSGVNYRFKIISHTGLYPYSSRYNCVQNCTVLYLPVGLPSMNIGRDLQGHNGAQRRVALRAFASMPRSR